MSAKWNPADDELDAMARDLPAAVRSADRIEHERTNVLAQAATLVQHQRGSRLPTVIAMGAALAAAAAVLIWFVARPGDTMQPKETITAIGAARYERSATWPDFIVRVDDGRVEIQVSPLATNERFRAITSDAEVEVRGTKFAVIADHGKLAFVGVDEGRVELRWAHEPPVILAAGQTWSPVKTAQRDDLQLAPAKAEPASSTIAVAKPRVDAPKITRAGDIAAIARPRVDPVTTNQTAKSVPAPANDPATSVVTPRPGEAEFRAGIAALRAGNAVAATQSFATACAAQNAALGEDACFWLGASAKRAGEISTARDALTRFLQRYPTSARAGEAAALLGWILYDAGELDAAKQRFDVAATDRVPDVKQSAERGLEAIKRKRARP